MSRKAKQTLAEPASQASKMARKVTSPKESDGWGGGENRGGGGGGVEYGVRAKRGPEACGVFFGWRGCLCGAFRVRVVYIYIYMYVLSPPKDRPFSVF